MNKNVEGKENIKAITEALIFASPKPISCKDIHSIISQKIDLGEDKINDILAEIKVEYSKENKGFELFIFNDEYQFRTKDILSEYVEKLFSTRPKTLSRAAQETLAIIAYRQPVTRADIEFVRGVDAGSIIKNLLERELITCIGRKEELGKPMLFATTDEFLRVYSLKNIKDLPPLESFQPSYDTISSALEKISGKNQENTVEIEKNVLSD